MSTSASLQTCREDKNTPNRFLWGHRGLCSPSLMERAVEEGRAKGFFFDLLLPLPPVTGLQKPLRWAAVGSLGCLRQASVCPSQSSVLPCSYPIWQEHEGCSNCCFLCIYIWHWCHPGVPPTPLMVLQADLASEVVSTCLHTLPVGSNIL